MVEKLRLEREEKEETEIPYEKEWRETFSYRKSKKKRKNHSTLMLET